MGHRRGQSYRPDYNICFQKVIKRKAKEFKTGTPTDSCMPIFMGTLFTTVQRWKQTKCSSIGE